MEDDAKNLQEPRTGSSVSDRGERHNLGRTVANQVPSSCSAACSHFATHDFHLMFTETEYCKWSVGYPKFASRVAVTVIDLHLHSCKSVSQINFTVLTSALYCLYAQFFISPAPRRI